jgi:ATP-dependent RNA helicase RhlB
MDTPVEIVIESETVTVNLVTQELYHVGMDEKLPVLLGLLKRENARSVLIFCNQKRMTSEIAMRLTKNGINCEFIMGDLPQSKRLQIIENLKSGKLPLLVATDVAARGLDVDGLDLVINYDIPMDPEAYVHRIGRTARAGASGKAITLACEKFVYGLEPIEKFIEMKIPVIRVTDDLLIEDKSAGTYFERYRKTRVPHIQKKASATIHKKPKPASSVRVKKHKPVDPYHLSSEERMKQYREKYGTALKKPVQENQESQKNISILSRIVNFFKQRSNV